MITMVHKGVPCSSKDRESNAYLKVTKPISSCHMNINEARATYKKDAKKVMRVLKKLPQGTRYQVFLLMFKDQESLYQGV